jgi:hypothetical protein
VEARGASTASLKIRNVQALRAFAALMVVGVHLPLQEGRIFGQGALLGWLNSAGAIGVDLFFVISGFIMVTTTWEAFGRGGAASAFLMRRILRIYPFYLVTFSLQLMLAGAAPWALHWAPQTPWELFASFTLIPHDQDPVMVVAWSLQFEVYFYLCFALALRYARTNLPVFVALWGALTLAAAALSVAFPNVPLRFVGSPLTFEFLMGVAVGALAITGRLVAPRTLGVLGLAGLVVAAALATRYPDAQRQFLPRLRLRAADGAARVRRGRSRGADAPRRAAAVRRAGRRIVFALPVAWDRDRILRQSRRPASSARPDCGRRVRRRRLRCRGGLRTRHLPAHRAATHPCVPASRASRTGPRDRRGPGRRVKPLRLAPARVFG